MQGQCAQVVGSCTICNQHNVLYRVIARDDASTTFVELLHIKVLLHHKSLVKNGGMSDAVKAIGQNLLMWYIAVLSSVMLVLLHIIRIVGDDVPTPFYHFEAIRLYLECVGIGLAEALVSHLHHFVLAHGLHKDGQPSMSRGDVLKLHSVFQLAVRLYLIERGVGVDEPTAQTITLQFFGVHDVVLVALYVRVEFDDNVKDVKYRLAMVMKSAQRQFVTVPITQTALLPLVANFLVCKMPVVAERINEPYISSELVCRHIVILFVNKVSYLLCK